MENIDIYKSLIGACIGLVATVVTFIIKGHGNAIRTTRSGNLITIKKRLLEWISKAEEFTNYSSGEKKEYVLTKASRFALENKIDYCEESINEMIEELIHFSKNVNQQKGITDWLSGGDKNVNK